MRSRLYLLLALGPLLRVDVAAADVAGGSPPYSLDTDRELALVLGGGIILGGALLLQRQLQPLDEAEVAELEGTGMHAGWLGLEGSARRRWSPKANRVSNLTLGLSQVGPIIQAISEGENSSEDPGTLLLIYGETMLLTTAVNQLVKGLVHRTRPFVYNPDPRIPPEMKQELDARRSFFSGHSAASFAAAVQFSMIYENLDNGRSSGTVWGISLGLATLTGGLRYVAGKHYLSDIVVGAAVGSFVGWLIPTLHELDSDSTDSGSFAASSGSPKAATPMLTLSFGF